VTFLITYILATFLIVPFIAPLFGREPVMTTKNIKPTNYMSVFLNRNYVRPKLNKLLLEVSNDLENKAIQINYLDANFPFINKFPLLPHLSHNDGKKIDISLVYETENGEISKKQRSRSGYGVFVIPKKEEHNQIKTCLEKGYFQYDYPKYLTLGKINRNLVFSKKGTVALIKSILKRKELGKLFIEPHLKTRMSLQNKKIRYHGCRAVRHDDHIHIQLK
jgi:murein endopeptidase